MNLRLLTLSWLQALIIFSPIAVTQVSQAAPPNVLVIITDEHNFRTLGCYREQLPREQAEMWGDGVIVETPNIDRLAHRGLIGMRAYATAPVCSPSRAAMITGRYPHNTGVPTNDMELRSDLPTLASLLATNGYRTSFIGKWHLAGESKPGWAPEIDGGFEDKRYMFNRGHWKKLILTAEGPAVGAASAKGVLNYNVDGADETTFATDFLTDRTVEFISESSDQPFLSVVSYPDPHGPNTVRPPYDHQYDQFRFAKPRTYGLTDVASPAWLGGAKNHAIFRGQEMSRYFGMVKCIDDNIGKLLAALKTTGKLDSTIIVFTSDHGDLCYEHDRLNKGNPYEGSARVPMLISYPPMIKERLVYSQPIGTVDVTPTIISLAGIKTDVKFEGRSLTDWISNGPSEKESSNDSLASRELTFLRNAGNSAQWLAAVDDRYKLILSVNDRPWLFDAESDPDELLNFYGRPESNEVVARLAKSLQQYCEQTQDPFAQHPKINDSLQLCLSGKGASSE